MGGKTAISCAGQCRAEWKSPAHRVRDMRYVNGRRHVNHQTLLPRYHSRWEPDYGRDAGQFAGHPEPRYSRGLMQCRTHTIVLLHCPPLRRRSSDIICLAQSRISRETGWLRWLRLDGGAKPHGRSLDARPADGVFG